MVRYFVLCILSTALVNCQSARPPVSQIQFCLRHKSDIPLLKARLKEIAQEEGLEYFDWSNETQKQLSNAAKDFPEIARDGQILNIAIRRVDGLGVGGGNIGLPENRVSLGFTAGPSMQEAEALAHRTISELRKTWTIIEVPKGQGVPLQSPC